MAKPKLTSQPPEAPAADDPRLKALVAGAAVQPARPLAGPAKSETKLVRMSVSMPAEDAAFIDEVQRRIVLAGGSTVTASRIVRAGLLRLVTLPDDELLQLVKAMEEPRKK